LVVAHKFNNQKFSLCDTSRYIEYIVTLHQQKKQSRNIAEETKAYFAIFTLVLFQQWFYVSC